MLAKLYDEKWPARRRIIEVFSALKREETLPLLTKALKHGKSSVSWTAGFGLAQHPSAEAGQILVDQILATQSSDFANPAQWRTAMFWLGERGRDCKVVLPFLTDPDLTRRFYGFRAAHSMGCVGQSMLKNALKDASIDVRQLAEKRLAKQAAAPTDQ